MVDVASTAVEVMECVPSLSRQPTETFRSPLLSPRSDLPVLDMRRGRGTEDHEERETDSRHAPRSPCRVWVVGGDDVGRRCDYGQNSSSYPEPMPDAAPPGPRHRTVPTLGARAGSSSATDSQYGIFPHWF